MWYLIVSIPDLCTLTYFVVVIGLVLLVESGLLHDASMAFTYFQQMCPAGLSKANSFDIETKFDLCITNSIVSSGIYHKRYDFGLRKDFFSFLKNTFLAPLLMVWMVVCFSTYAAVYVSF